MWKVDLLFVPQQLIRYAVYTLAGLGSAIILLLMALIPTQIAPDHIGRGLFNIGVGMILASAAVALAGLLFYSAWYAIDRITRGPIQSDTRST